MATGSTDVRVENQLVRFVCPTPLDHDRVVAEVGGQRNSGVVIKAMERPRATLVIDEEGRIVVHGTHRVEAARAAAKELLLRMGMDDSGPVRIAPFNADTIGNQELDIREGALVRDWKKKWHKKTPRPTGRFSDDSRFRPVTMEYSSGTVLNFSPAGVRMGR